MNKKEWIKNEVCIGCSDEDKLLFYGNNRYGEACRRASDILFDLYADECDESFIYLVLELLKRLIYDKPLTKVYDDTDSWLELNEPPNYQQHKRLSSLFKKNDCDGNVCYIDVNRVICVDIHSGMQSHSSFADQVVYELYPIKMPYFPETIPYVVYYTDEESVTKVLFVITPNGLINWVNSELK